MRRRRGIVIAAAAALVGATFLVVRGTDREAEGAEYCSVSVGQTRAEVDLEQARYASLISATGVQRGLPARASSIAIATGFQESKLHNIDYGDRDSVGLFQQRPSQGWGTAEQLTDPHYAIGAFFDALVEVEGYRQMEITKAAQAVQRSAYGGAYAKHEAYSRALASALTGYTEAAFTCRVHEPGDGSAEQLHGDVTGAFGEVEAEKLNRGMRYAAADARTGWAIAHYAVANAKRLGVHAVAFDGRRWRAEHSADGWTRHDEAESGAVTVTLG